MSDLSLTAIAALIGLPLAILSASAAPQVTGFSPVNGPTGAQVTVTGANFASVTRVAFGQGTADFVVLSSTALRATVPPEATTGSIQVSDAVSSGFSANPFLAGPRIADITPSRGATNTQVSITGANFTDLTSVRFGTLPAAFVVTGAGGLLVTVPYGATNAPITLQNPAASATSASDFIITTQAPILDGFSPEIGAPGTTISLQGLNFISVTAIRFGTIQATSFNVPTYANINAVVPLNATSAPITVVTSGGSSVSSKPFTVTYGPVITNFTPRMGKPGIDVTLSGINFSNLTGVSFGGIPATAVSPGLLQGEWKATVPPTAVTGPVGVTTRIGGVTRTGTSAVPFLVTSAPVISSFEPNEGPPGTPITILGVNLSNGPTKLYIGTTPTAFTKLQTSPDYLVARVPTGAFSGTLTLSNQFGAFTTPTAFSVLDQRPFLTGFSPMRGPRGTQVELRGFNFSNPITVRFNGVAAAETTTASPGGMSVTVPADATTGPITVTTSKGTTTNLNRFEVPPRITAITPTRGFVGQTVTITGQSFTNTTAVEFAGAPAAFTRTTDTTLSAIVPLEAATGPLRVTTLAGTTLSFDSFHVLPQVLLVEPALGPNGTQVHLRGTTLGDVSGVTFNNRPATFSILSSTEIRTFVPATATTGPIKILTPSDSFTTPSNFVVTTSSDLHLVVAAAEALVEPGQFLDFALTLTNTGSSALTGIRLTNTLPAGLAFDSLTTSQGTWSESGGVTIVNLGVLLTNAFAHLTLRAQAVAERVWTNRAAVGSVEPDWTVADNRAETRVTVLSTLHRTLDAQPLSESNAVVLLWPVSAVPLQLQAVDSLLHTNTWRQVPTPPAVSGGWNRFTNVTSGASKFYRLATPP